MFQADEIPCAKSKKQSNICMVWGIPLVAPLRNYATRQTPQHTYKALHLAGLSASEILLSCFPSSYLHLQHF